MKLENLEEIADGLLHINFDTAESLDRALGRFMAGGVSSEVYLRYSDQLYEGAYFHTRSLRRFRPDTDEESDLKSAVLKTKAGYVIATYGRNFSTALCHEVAHYLYDVYKSYRTKVRRILKAIDKRDLRNYLVNHLNTPEIGIYDEMQASIVENVRVINRRLCPRDSERADRIRQLFREYARRYRIRVQ